MFHEEDVEKIIEEIQKRPALYNKHMDEYGNNSLKNTLWEEVCSAVVPDWDNLSGEYKAQAGRELKRKWQNLRTCFGREVRKQRSLKPLSKKRRKYIFYEKLLFLLPSLETKPNDFYPVSDEEDNPEDEDDAESEKLQKVCIEMTKIEGIDEQQQKVCAKTEHRVEEPAVRNGDEEEVHFVLSLVSMLKELDRKTKLEAKIRILRVFQELG